jgi:hypothetical protein
VRGGGRDDGTVHPFGRDGGADVTPGDVEDDPSGRGRGLGRGQGQQDGFVGIPVVVDTREPGRIDGAGIGERNEGRQHPQDGQRDRRPGPHAVYATPGSASAQRDLGHSSRFETGEIFSHPLYV